MPKKKFEVSRANAARLAWWYGGEAAMFRQPERSARGKAIADRAAKRRILPARGEKVRIIFQKFHRPVFPAARARWIAASVKFRPPQAIITPRIGRVVIHGFIHPIDEPTSAQ